MRRLGSHKRSTSHCRKPPAMYHKRSYFLVCLGDRNNREFNKCALVDGVFGDACIFIMEMKLYMTGRATTDPHVPTLTPKQLGWSGTSGSVFSVPCRVEHSPRTPTFVATSKRINLNAGKRGTFRCESGAAKDSTSVSTL